MNSNEVGTKRFQFLKILIIKPFKSIIKCKKRTKQNSDYQKTSFVRFLYSRSDFCPTLFLFDLQFLLGKTSKTNTYSSNFTLLPSGKWSQHRYPSHDRDHLKMLFHWLDALSAQHLGIEPRRPHSLAWFEQR